MSTYTQAFKENLLAKLLTPGGPSVVELSQTAKVPKQTLYLWLAKAKRDNTTMSKSKDKNHPPVRPQNWSAEAKLNAVIETASMTEEERGLYCRKNGLYTHHLDQWKQALLEGLKPSVAKENRQEFVKLKGEKKQLERELRRKEKALAEASALLILKKKAELLWGTEEDED